MTDMVIDWKKEEKVKWETAVERAVTALGNAKVAIQIAAVALLIRLVKGKGAEWADINDFVEALEGANRKSLVEWFKKYGYLSVDKQGFTGCLDRAAIAKTLDLAKAKPWYSVAGDKPFADFNVFDAVLQQFSTAEKKLKVAKTDADKAKIVHDPVFAQKVRAIIADMRPAA